MTFSAVVLAAGESRRMGRPKLLLPYGGSTILETVLASVQGAPIERTIVVLGFGRERIEPLVRRFPVEIGSWASAGNGSSRWFADFRSRSSSIPIPDGACCPRSRRAWRRFLRPPAPRLSCRGTTPI
ncbi:MAG: NTP transferase domain-containing protein [Candidatus Aminicenantes bacterium]|nr:NTP transferase domain-containing protein [Candidatus Aminicenantes bacterium]